MKKLYTGGTFDLLHIGHLNFLKHCRNLADHVTVSLNTDEFIEDFKGGVPIMNYRERRSALLYSEFADEVVPNIGGRDSKPAIEQVEPRIIAIGDDWAHKDYYAQMSFTQEWLDEREITLVYVPYTKGISTTEIKKRIAESIGR